MSLSSKPGAVAFYWVLTLAISPGFSGELAIVNGRIFDNPGATAVLVRGERIAAIGSEAVVAALAMPGAARLDARGGHVLPGFHDSHVHLLDGGLARNRVTLPERGGLADVLDAVRRYGLANPGKPWIVGGGWEYRLLTDGVYPTRRQLDEAVATRPVYLESYDGHSVWLNSAALVLAGVTAATVDPPGGRIVRESDGRTPAGCLLESAVTLVSDAPPEPSREEKLSALEFAARSLLALGVTSVDHIAHGEEELELLEQLASDGRLPVRVRVSLPLEGDLERYRVLRARHRGPFVKVGFLKGFLDGVIESKTAFMLQPYEGASEKGQPLFTLERLRTLVKRAQDAGFQVGLHTVGDAAVQMALEVYESLCPPGRPNPWRHRVEHVEVLEPGDARRFVRAGAIASMQPYHAVPSSTTPETDVWSRNLGPGRLRVSFPWKSLLDAGAALAFGSDWNVMSPDPLLGIAVAATRRNRDGELGGGFGVNQIIGVADAVRAYTAGAARAAHAQWDYGRIAPGMLADIVVLSPQARLDIPSTLWNSRVDWVVVGGAVKRAPGGP